MLILFRILHVETMFGNEGEGFLYACISSLVVLWYSENTIIEIHHWRYINILTAL